MTVQDLKPYFGIACCVRLRCHACGGRHVLVGEIDAGRHAGDVVVQGHTYSIEDVEAIWRPAQPPSGRLTSVGLFQRLRSLAAAGTGFGP